MFLRGANGESPAPQEKMVPTFLRKSSVPERNQLFGKNAASFDLRSPSCGDLLIGVNVVFSSYFLFQTVSYLSKNEYKNQKKHRLLNGGILYGGLDRI